MDKREVNLIEAAGRDSSRRAMASVLRQRDGTHQ